MHDREPEGMDHPGQLRIAMLKETVDAAVEVAGPVWPTPAMALGSVFERGALLLQAGGTLPRLSGSAPSAALAKLNETREDLYLVEALCPLTRYVAFKLTGESTALEATWLSLADRHLDIRARIVACRREEERLKRELVLLGGATVALPEHEDLPDAGSDRPRKSRGMFSRLFAGASIVEAMVDAAPPLVRLADGVAHAKGWVQEWGDDAPLLVLTHGLSLALREREAESINTGDEASVSEAQETARTRLMGLDGRYSTLRRRLFELRHNNRILRWRITALEIEARGMQSRLDQFLTDRDRLEQEIAARRADGAVTTESPEPRAPPAGWRRRIARLLGASE
jgi:hypothetical protein